MSRALPTAALLSLLVHAGAAPAAEDGWIELVGEEGLVGVHAEGREGEVTLCGDVKLGEERNTFVAIPGKGVACAVRFISNLKLYSVEEFTDCEVYAEFALGRGGNSGVKMQGHYEVQLFDSHEKEVATARDCGGIYPHWSRERIDGPLTFLDKGYPPLVNAAKPAGEWQTIELSFVAPRFSADGEKTANARFESVVLNGVIVQQDVELDSPTGNIEFADAETPRGSILLQLDHGAAAFRNVRVRPTVGH